LPVDDAKTVFLHYWFVTSTNNPKSDPVAIWMNGGPGCSSLGGALIELGPYTFTGQVHNDSGVPELMNNLNAWTTVSSVLFLEQPAGVGFSYAVNGSTHSDDYIQSQNTYGFLLNFFGAYPEYANNDFYITGESYAGVYVPTLAYRILEGNKAGKPHVNLKGIAVGNGCWGSEVGTCCGSPDSDRIAITNYYYHAMVSEQLWIDIHEECGPTFNSTSKTCRRLIRDGLSVGNIDIYDVYDVCPGDSATSALKSLRAPVGALQHVEDPVVCVDNDLSNQFLDNPEVRKAFHLENSSVTNWQDCSGIDYNSNLPDERPMYAVLIENIRVLIYNGDADACVPWVGNYEWVRSMNIPETSAWHPWQASTVDGSRSWTGGFVTEYGKNFTFLTIKHAGHMVPQYEPEAAITFYSKFLKDEEW